MADSTCSATAEENVNILSDDRLNNIKKLPFDDKSFIVEKGKLEWMKSLESLQNFVATSLQLKGHWSAPSGHLKLFKETSGSITIRYYSNTTSIIFQEDQGKKLENILLEKIASNQRSSEARLAANDDESVEEDPYSDQIESLAVQTTADPNLNSDTTCTVNLSCLNDKSIEEDYSDLNESLIVQTTADPNLNSGKTCIGNLSCVNEGLLSEALANETNRQNSTAMTCNSSQTNGNESNGVPPRNANSVHSCSCQQLVNEMVTLKYTISSLKSSIYSFETILKDHDIVLSLYNRSSDINERYL